MNYDIWFAFTTISAAFLLIPGPRHVLILRYGQAAGRGMALMAAIGMTTGSVFGLFATLSLLGSILQISQAAFYVVVRLSEVTLACTGLAMILASPAGYLSPPERPTGYDAFWQNAAHTALNPRVIAFYFAFVPTFLQPTNAFGGQFLIMGTTFATLVFATSLAYVGLSAFSTRILETPIVVQVLNRAIGGAMLGMAALMAYLT